MTLLRIAKACLAAVTLSCLPAAAGAVIIVVDPRDHAVGADISHAYDGLTMRRLNQNPDTSVGYDPVAAPVIVGTCHYGPSSACLGSFWEVNEWSACAGSPVPTITCSREPWGVLELTFDVPTNLIQFTSFFGSDPPGMILLDSGGNRIGNCWGLYGSTHPDCGYTYQPYEWNPDAGYFRDNIVTLTFDSTVANVSRVVFAGVAGTVPANQILYRYNVPEPGTLALLGLGLAGIGVARRRRKKLLSRC